MCNAVTSKICHSSLCNNSKILVSDYKKRQQYLVLVHQKTSDICQKVTVLNMADMTSVPTSACAKDHRLPSGAAFCFGEFDSDCPYVFQSGGQGKYQKQLYFYDVLRDKWKELGKTRKDHCDHKMHCVKKKLYIIGGRNEGIIEEYDVVNKDKKDKITAKQTTHIRGCLKVNVHNFSSVVFDDKIYVFGGISNVYPTKCVQYFDTRTGIVSQLSDLPTECQGGCAVVFRDTIYIATEQKRLIKFDPASGQSCFCANQPDCRRNFAAVVRNDKLHLLGGEMHFGNANEDNNIENPDLFSDHVSDSDFVNESDTMFENGHRHLRDCSYDPLTDCWKIENGDRSLKVAASFIVEYSQPCVFTPFQKDPYTRVHHRCRR